MLNEQQFDWDLVGDNRKFHGTTTDVPGKTLKPSAKTGKENYDYESFHDGRRRKENVFFTVPVDHLSGDKHSTPEVRAWQWGSSGTHNFSVQGGKRPHVYEVEPRGEVQKDTVIGAAMAPSARIKNRIDIPPLAAVQHVLRSSKNWTPVAPHGVQGTFPGINWDEYHDKGAEAAGAHRQRAEAIDEIREKQRMSGPNPAQQSLFNDRRKYRPKDWYEDEHE